MDNSYELTVQVSDGSLVTTQALQVRVTDLFRPIVETGLVESLTGSAVTLKGEVVDDGGMAVTGRGIVFSIDPDPELGKPGVTHLAASVGLRGVALWAGTDAAVWRPPNPVIELLQQPVSPRAVLATVTTLFK